jgi:D-amino-acid dehydrogenase
MVAPGYVTPWAAPGMPRKVLATCSAAMRRCARAAAGRARLRWMLRWRSACNLETYLANRARLQRLAFYSRERLHWLTEDAAAGIRPQPGYLVLLRSEKDRKLVQPGCRCCATPA